jgi:hypothetical protein
MKFSFLTAAWFVIFAAVANRGYAVDHAFASASGGFAEFISKADDDDGESSAEIDPPIEDENGSSRFFANATVLGPELSVHTEAHQEDPLGVSAFANASATWADTLRIDNPEVLVDFPEWPIIANVYFRPQARGTILNGRADFSSYLLYYDEGTPLESYESKSASSNGTGLLRLPKQTIPLVYVSEGVVVELQLTAGAGTDPSRPDATVDFSHTAYLPPIFIGDADGNPIPQLAGLRLKGDSGNYYPVTTVQRTPGDYNGNGSVDAADYVVWRKSVGQTGLSLAADGDGSQAVDDDDYLVWQMNFGETVASGAASTADAAVPEPTTGVMTLIAALVAVIARYSRRIH